MRIVEGKLVATGMKVAVCVGRFNELVTERLEQGAIDALVRHGAQEADLHVFRCAGAFELGPLAQRVAQTGRYDAVIALGAVIRGGTPHFDHVANACTASLRELSMSARCAVAFGVLTCDTMEQAIDRAGGKAGNKGAEAALAAIEQASLFRMVEAGE